jgi:hypothetical protein
LIEMPYIPQSVSKMIGTLLKWGFICGITYHSIKNLKNVSDAEKNIHLSVSYLFKFIFYFTNFFCLIPWTLHFHEIEREREQAQLNGGIEAVVIKRHRDSKTKCKRIFWLWEGMTI